MTKKQKRMTMNRRAGTSLMEVLVTIFVMAIGLLSLLTLFPLGAMNMAQAIKDDRSADVAQLAASVARFQNVRGDSKVTPGYTASTSTTDGPSYPVYVDPAGVLTGASTLGSIPRKGVSFATTQANIDRWFTFLDDITFGENGLPSPSGTGAIERDNRYTWAYLVRLPRSGSTDYASADLTVVIYDRRPLVYNSSTKMMAGETVCNNTVFDPTSTTTTLTWTAGQATPGLKKGSWILDATVKDDEGKPHGYFYRVVGVTPISANSAEVELQTYPKQAKVSSGTAIIMENVAEVFEKGAN